MKSSKPTWTLCNLEKLDSSVWQTDGPVFATLTPCFIFFYLVPLMPFSPFSGFKTPWIFKSTSLASSIVWLWNYQNRIHRFGKPDSLVFPALPNLVINRTIMVDDINLTSPRDLSLAMWWTSWVWVWTVHHLDLGWKTIFSMKWYSCLNINMSTDCSTQPKKIAGW
jgi:hypothetical protein